MNKLTITTVLLLLIHSVSHATTITGGKAQQLYSLLKVQPKQVDGVSIKNFATTWQCQEKMVVTDSPFLVYEYTCLVPEAGADGRIHFDGEVAHSLFDELLRLGCSNKLRTRQTVNTLTRTYLAMECQELDYVGGRTEYRCAFTL